MKITVMGASGQIGSKVVALLKAAGHDIVGASHRTGADVVTSDGLAEALAGAEAAAEVARAAQAAPDDGIIDIGGPEKMTFAELATLALAHRGEPLPIVIDPDAVYFGARVGDTGLVTGDGATLAETRLADWLATQ